MFSIIKLVNVGDSKLLGHHQEDQEAQGCPPSRVKENIKDILQSGRDTFYLCVTVHLICEVEYIKFVGNNILFACNSVLDLCDKNMYLSEYIYFVCLFIVVYGALLWATLEPM